MPGFASSFPDPDPRDVERYKKFARVADPASGAAPSEMQSARREMEKLEATFPRIRVLVINAPPTAPAAPPKAGVWDVVQEVLGAVKTVVHARRTAQESTEVTSRILSDGRLRISVTIDANAVEAVCQRMDVSGRHNFVVAIADLTAGELHAVLADLEDR